MRRFPPVSPAGSGHVAAGRVDGFFEVAGAGSPWDFAAGELLMKRAVSLVGHGGRQLHDDR